MAPADKLDPVADVVSSILVNADASGEWRLTFEELVCLIGADDLAVHRFLYGTSERAGDAAPSTFGHENVITLIDILSRFCAGKAREQFEASGIVLSQNDRNELTERFLRTVGEKTSQEAIDREAFHGMLRTFRSVNRAVATYLEHFFSVSAIIDSIARQFVAESAYPAGAVTQSAAIRYLSMLPARKVFSPDGFLSRLESYLRNMAGETGGARRESGEGFQQRDSRLFEALRALGLDRLPSDRDALKRHYKVLMKTYHPDVNPAGLEICQRINSAYALLCGEMLSG